MPGSTLETAREYVAVDAAVGDNVDAVQTELLREHCNAGSFEIVGRCEPEVAPNPGGVQDPGLACRDFSLHAGKARKRCSKG